MPNLHPEAEAHVQAQPHICAYCSAYTFRVQGAGGWAFCREKNEWFDDQKDGVPCGLRTCPSWK